MAARGSASDFGHTENVNTLVRLIFKCGLHLRATLLDRRSRCLTSSSWASRGQQFEDLDSFRPRLGRQPVDGVSHVQSGVALLLDADSFHYTGRVSQLAVNLPE